MYLDVADNGSIRLNFPDLEVHQLKASCALDVADQGVTALNKIAELTNLTRERVRQLEEKLLEELARHEDTKTLFEHTTGCAPKREGPLYVEGPTDGDDSDDGSHGQEAPGAEEAPDEWALDE